MRVIQRKSQKKLTTLVLLMMGITSGGILIAGGITGNPILLGAGAAGLLFVCVGSIGFKKTPQLPYIV